MRRNLLISALILVIQQSAFSQRVVSAEEFNPADPDKSGMLSSVFKEYYKAKLYDLAIESFWELFNDFPDKSEKLYVDGVNMYRHFIKEASDEQDRNNKIDTLMMIYDQRMVHFGGEGNVLGRKGNDLLRYRSEEKDQVLEAYGMLKQSLELQGAGSRSPVVLNYITSGLMLYNSDRIDVIEVLEDYFLVTEIINQQSEGSSRWDKTRSTVDRMILKEDILSCAGLDLYFGPRYGGNETDQDLLKKIITYYSNAGCKQSDLYVDASEKLYELSPNSESAHSLAVLFIGRNDLEKASSYLNMALVDGSLPEETRAEWLYEHSIVSLARGEYCEAIAFAREVLANNKDHAKAYVAMGDAFIACRHQLGDEFQQRSAYWAAADAYQAALSKDPGMAEESNEKLAMCAAQYPSSEDIFFQDLKKGNKYRVGGCINKNTTIRSRD